MIVFFLSVVLDDVLVMIIVTIPYGFSEHASGAFELSDGNVSSSILPRFRERSR